MSAVASEVDLFHQSPEWVASAVRCLQWRPAPAPRRVFGEKTKPCRLLAMNHGALKVCQVADTLPNGERAEALHVPGEGYARRPELRGQSGDS